MKKKMLATGLVGLTLSSAIMIPAQSVSAEEGENIPTQTQNTPNTSIPTVSNNVSSNLDLLDPFVKVENNQYILKLSDNVKFSEQLISEAKKQIEVTNTTIKEKGLTINPETKTAYMGSLLRAAGKNSVTVHWNYWRIYLNKDTTNAIIRAGAIGGSALVIGAIPQLSSIGASVAGAAIGSFVSDTWKSPVSNGIWFDFNTYYFSINNYGWQ